MTINRTFSDVEDIRNAMLCHGCGMCEAVCPHDALAMIYDNRSMHYVPDIDREKCKECSLCVDVCPGKEVKFVDISKQFLACRKYELLAGYYINNYLGWANDKDIRWRAASGGVATALAKYLLESCLVNKVVVVKSVSGKEPLDFRGTIITEVDQLDGAMGSKYCPVTLCGALKEITPDDRIAVIGLPCHIHGLRKAQLNNKSFQKIDLTLIGIFCGGTLGREATDWIIRRSGFDSNKLVKINYRGNGWPGQLTADFVGGKKLILPYPEYSDLQYNGFIPWRCKLCSDGVAELADISIGDAWLKEVTSSNDQGVSMIVTRSQKGEAILNKAKAAGVIDCKICKDDDVIRSQYNLLLRKKYHIKGSMFLAKIIGRCVPNYDNIYKKTDLIYIFVALKRELRLIIGRFTANHLLFYKFLNSIKYFLKKRK